jgi:regulator of extracellular matrix RemA (YlzA/DUF370 family)
MMYIHIGQKRIISDKYSIGIFNIETLKLSELNDWIIENLAEEHKSVAIDIENNVIFSKVSPFTVIKRKSIEEDCFWRKEDE